ncbi:MAG: tetratricopeptide repeat protein [Opitutales bacterium]|nr:tetratricopeptide repeat protein [Opitutales bacterium]
MPRVPLIEEEGWLEIERESGFLRALSLGEQAHEEGFPSLAIDFFQEALAALPSEDPRREGALLDLSAAYLAAGQLREAEELLQANAEFEGPRWDLRRAIVTFEREDRRELDRLIAGFPAEMLPEAERGIFYFLRGLHMERRGRMENARDWYERILEMEVGPALIARTRLAQFRLSLLGETPSEDLLREVEAQVEEYSGRVIGFRFILQQAALLHWLDRREEALEVLRTHYPRLPEEARELREQYLLLEGLVAGQGSSRGRESLRRLLEIGERRSYLRSALAMLLREEFRQDGGEEALGELLDGLVELEPPHLLLDEILFHRSQLRLALGDYEGAGADAQRILEEFPAAQVVPLVLQTQALLAWDQNQFRTASNRLAHLRDRTENPARRAEWSLLLGDSYFRAGDYANAAEAYEEALRGDESRINRSRAFYQRVLAEIRRGDTGAAKVAMDQWWEVFGDGDYSGNLLWRAEWNLVRTLQRENRRAAGMDRVDRLLQNELASDQEEAQTLRLRLRWLRAQMSYEVGNWEGALTAAIALKDDLDALEATEEAWWQRLVSHTLLLRANILLRLGKIEEGVEVFEEVYQNFPETDAAVYAVLSQARYLAEQGQTVTAANVLENLIQSVRGDEDEDEEALERRERAADFLVIAYYEAALYHLRSGHDTNFQEKAIARLESLVRDFPGHPMGFYARVRQGDILRQMNRFSAARQVYETVLSSHPEHAELSRVRLAIADSHLAQAEEIGDRHAVTALGILERLLDLPDLTPDVRSEASYKLGQALERFGERGRARTIYFQVAQTLKGEEPVVYGTTGRFWVARALLALSRLLESPEETERALEIHRLFTEQNLPGVELLRGQREEL